MLTNLASSALHGWNVIRTFVPLPSMLALGALLFAVRALWKLSRRYAAQAAWEQSRRQELEAYSGLEAVLPAEIEPRKLAEQGKRVCRLIVDKSCYRRAAFYLRNPSGEMVCVGSSGMDDLTLAALDMWGSRVVLEEGTESARGGEPRDNERRTRDAVKSFNVVLAARDTLDAMPGQGCGKATIVPLRMARGRLVGVLAVCVDEVMALETERAQQAVMPIEVLGARLAGFVERSLMMQRLMEVERLAVASQIVAGVARELTEPLGAVLGLAETMREMASEPRAQKEAQMMVTHALKMREILEGLRGFWRPGEADAGKLARSQDARQR